MKRNKLLKDIQANVLKPHNRNFCLFLFCNWKISPNISAEDYKEWVRKIGADVTSHYLQAKATKRYKKSKKQSFVTFLGLTFAAYEAMRIPQDHIPDDKDFDQGMHASAGKFFPSYAPDKKFDILKDALKDPTLHHAMICIAHDSYKKLQRKKEELLSDPLFKKILIDDYPLVVCIEQKRKKGSSKSKKGSASGPFGFEDNISIHKKKADLLKAAFGINDPLKSNIPDNGTYLCFQKIHIHRKKFDYHGKKLGEILGENGRKYADEKLGKALIIGRFSNGTPLALSDQANNLLRDEENNFDYGDDNLGSKCPLHAHIRSTNPRIKGNKVVPIVRRGIVYEEQRNGSTEETLFFLSYQASIEKNLVPIFERMLKGKDESNPWRTDALIYPKSNIDINYYNRYGKSEPENKVTYPRVGVELTTIVTGAFYYCPSKTFLDDPK